MTVTGRRIVYAVPVDACQIIKGVAGIMADEQMFRQILVKSVHEQSDRLFQMIDGDTC